MGWAADSGKVVRRVAVVVLVVAGHVRIGLVLADVSVTIAFVVVDDVDVRRSYGTGVLQVVVLRSFRVDQTTQTRHGIAISQVRVVNAQRNAGRLVDHLALDDIRSLRSVTVSVDTVGVSVGLSVRSGAGVAAGRWAYQR